MRVYKKSCSIKRINTDENDRYFTCIYSHEHCYVSDSPFNFVKKTSSVFLFQWLQWIDCESWQFENRQLKRSVFPSFFQVTVCHRAGTERHPTIRTCGQFRITSLPNHTNCMCLDCGVPRGRTCKLHVGRPSELMDSNPGSCYCYCCTAAHVIIASVCSWSFTKNSDLSV